MEAGALVHVNLNSTLSCRTLCAVPGISQNTQFLEATGFKDTSSEHNEDNYNRRLEFCVYNNLTSD